MEMTITEAAKVRNVTRQAIYLAIKEGRLKVIKRGKLQKVKLESLIDLEKTRYVRAAKVFQGEDLYSDKKGVISPPKAAKLMNVGVSVVYNAIYSGKLKATKKGRSWIIYAKDLIPLQSSCLKPKRSNLTWDEIKKAFQTN